SRSRQRTALDHPGRERSARAGGRGAADPRRARGSQAAGGAADLLRRRPWGAEARQPGVPARVFTAVLPQIFAGEGLRGHDCGVDAALEQFAAHLSQVERASEHTQRAYLSDLRQLAAFLGERGVALDAATRDDLRAFLA